MLNQGPEYREPTTMPEISRLHPEKLLLFTHQPLYMYIRVAYWHTSVTKTSKSALSCSWWLNNVPHV